MLKKSYGTILTQKFCKKKMWKRATKMTNILKAFTEKWYHRIDENIDHTSHHEVKILMILTSPYRKSTKYTCRNSYVFSVCLFGTSAIILLYWECLFLLKNIEIFINVYFSCRASILTLYSIFNFFSWNLVWRRNIT